MREIVRVIRDNAGEMLRTEKRKVAEDIVLHCGDLHDLNLPDGDFLLVHALAVRVKDHIVDFVPVCGLPVEGVEDLGSQTIDQGRMKADIARTGRGWSITQLRADPMPIAAKKRRPGFIQ